MRLLTLALVLAFLTSTPALGQSVVVEEQTLAHLNGIKVFVIGNIGADAERDGLRRDAIRNDVELALRRSGVRVYDEAGDTAPTAYLQVQVSTFKDGGLHVYTLGVEVHQFVQLTNATLRAGLGRICMKKR